MRGNGTGSSSFRGSFPNTEYCNYTEAKTPRWFYRGSYWKIEDKNELLSRVQEQGEEKSIKLESVTRWKHWAHEKHRKNKKHLPLNVADLSFYPLSHFQVRRWTSHFSGPTVRRGGTHSPKTGARNAHIISHAFPPSEFQPSVAAGAESMTDGFTTIVSFFSLIENPASVFSSFVFILQGCT